MRPDARLGLRRLLEAWVYVLILLGVGAVCLVKQVWWPLYPAVGLLAALAYLRRI